MRFLKNHWKILAVTTLALAAAAVVAFFPPAIIATAIIALANTSAFAIMGAAAMPVAIATGAAVAAAAVYAVGGVAAGINWGVRKLIDLFFAKGTGPNGGDSATRTFNVEDDKILETPRIQENSASKSPLTASFTGVISEETVQPEAPVNYPNPLTAPKPARATSPAFNTAASTLDDIVEEDDKEAAAGNTSIATEQNKAVFQ